MVKTLDSAIKSGHGTALLYAGVLGLLLSDIIPTPADYFYFKFSRANRVRYENREITPQKYWLNEGLLYYGLNPLYWGLVLGAVIVTRGDVSQKAKVGLGIIAAGAVIGVLSKNIKQDVEQQKTINITKAK